jgi:hypothetical protein
VAGRLLVLALVSLLAAACGGHDKQPRAAKRERSRAFVFSPGAGKSIDVGNHRSLRLLCAGSGAPTVVVSAGEIDRAAAIQPELARTTRTCAYDSAGNGYSSDLPSRNGSDLQDLEKLLHAAHLPAPYVLVASSVESPVVSMFAKAHAAQTAGVILDQGVGANWRRRFLALGRGQPASVQRRLLDNVGPAVTEGVNWNAVGAQAASVTTLGHTPLAVVTAPDPPLNKPQDLPPTLRRAAARLLMTQQDELAALSTNHVHVVGTRSSDDVLRDQPNVVVRAVRAVVEAARTRTPLPSCARLFRGPGVRCRS